MSGSKAQGCVEEGSGQQQQPTAPMTINNSKKTTHCSVEISHCSPQKDEDSRSGTNVPCPVGSPGSSSSMGEDKQIAAEEWQRERRMRAFRGGWKTGDEELHPHSHGQSQCSTSISPS